MTAFIIVIIAVLSMYTVFAVIREGDKVRDELTGEGDMLARLLAFNSRVGVFAENRELLRDVAAGIIGQRHVVMVAIYGADLRLLYLVQKDPSIHYPAGDMKALTGGFPAHPTTATVVHESKHALEFVKPVVLSLYPNVEEALYLGDTGAEKTEKTIGYVRILLEKEMQRKEILGIVERNAIITLIFILASAVFIYWQVKKMTRPLEKLTAGVHALGVGGEVDLVPVETMDEVGKLASAFNTMLERRNRVEDALRSSEKKYRTLFEESKDVIFIDTPDDRIIDINPAGVELFGCSSKEELLASNVRRDLYLNPQDRDSFKKIMECRGFVKDHEVKFRRKNEDPLDINITATAVRDDTGTVVAYRGILRDVTAERNLEKQLLHSQKMEAVGRLTGGIAHEFNNILTAIVNYLSILQEETAENGALRGYVDRIDALVNNAAHLTQGLLAFSRKQIMNPMPVDINEIIRKMESLLSKLIGEDIDLMVRLSDEALVVTADSGRIEQVLMNFATNARDAMPRGGRLVIGTRRAEMDGDFLRTHGFGEIGDYAEIAVTDTGEGIDQATMKKIFEPFFTTKEPGKGTGLGLSIVYGIVKQHNGYITVTSEPGKGTTFTVSLPLKKTAEEIITPAE